MPTRFDVWCNAGRDDPDDLYLLARDVSSTVAYALSRALRGAGWTVELRPVP